MHHTVLEFTLPRCRTLLVACEMLYDTSRDSQSGNEENTLIVSDTIQSHVLMPLDTYDVQLHTGSNSQCLQLKLFAQFGIFLPGKYLIAQQPTIMDQLHNPL